MSSPSYNAQQNLQYLLHGKLMVSAILMLVILILFVLALHIYINWFRPTQRRRHRLSFTTAGGQDPFLGVATGLDKSIINSLPTFAFCKKGKSGDEKDSFLECAVCLSEFQENEKCRLLPNCKHSFHTDCIDMWFFSHSTCPLCRAMVVSPTLAPPSPPPPLPPPHQQQEQVATFLNDLSFTLRSPRREYSSTRSLPHLAIDIPQRRWDSNFTSPRCLSLSLPRCSSPLEQGCSSSTPPTLKSPSVDLGMSFKRLRSKEKRVLPSDKETSETDHYGAGSGSSVYS